jgi:hypothetical protein
MEKRMTSIYQLDIAGTKTVEQLTIDHANYTAKIEIVRADGSRQTKWRGGAGAGEGTEFQFNAKKNQLNRMPRKKSLSEIRAAAGRKGGRATSPAKIEAILKNLELARSVPTSAAKAEAVRKNGKKGGRQPDPEIVRITAERGCSRQRAHQILRGSSPNKLPP